ncbi:LON peptidase N-terminal domain and RING finger protein 3 [Chlorella vulgaris]
MLAFSKGGCTLIPCNPAPQTRAWGAGGVPHKAAPCQQQHRRSSKDGWPGSRRLATAQRQRRAQSLVPQAAARKPGGLREQLPIFPLGLVALPATEVPLQIFEARYRVLFSTLMAGAEGIDEGLVNPDKAWCGSRMFGMTFIDQKSQGLASIGTLLEITEHSNLEDGRLLVNNRGRQRFKILEVVEESPVLVCEVEYLRDEEDEGANSPEAVALAAEVAELFRSVVSLSVKLKATSVPADIANPRQLTELGPFDLSFWVASLFAGSPYQQQALLEEETTLGRLKASQELLSGTQRYLGAQVALVGAFKPSGGSESDASPPAGGPD